MPGAPYGSAGTQDISVERIEEGQPAIGSDIVVQLANGAANTITSTEADVKALVNGTATTNINAGTRAPGWWAATLVDVTGTPSGNAAAASVANLTGGNATTKASLTIGNLVFTAKKVGTAGNSITVAFINPNQANAPLRIRILGNGSSGNDQVRATFDANLSAGGKRAGQVAQVDTSAYGITPWAALERALPTAWGFGEESQAFTVANNASNNAAVGTVTFSGTGASPSYSIVSGNVSKTTPPGTPFAINSTTGAITRTTSGATIVAAETYILTVAVADAVGYEDTKTVTITVT